MKVLLIFAIVNIGLQATLSLPTPNTKSAPNNHDDTNSKVADPNNALRQKIKPLMATLLKSFQRVIDKTLNQLPSTVAYEDSRRKLNQFVASIQKYQGSQLENCLWNIVDLGYDLSALRQSFTSPEATAEDKETMRLLEENGFKDADRQHTSYWWRFMRGELGERGDEINGDYC